MDPCKKEATLENIMEALSENGKQLALLGQSQQHIIIQMERNSSDLVNIQESVSILANEVKELKILVREAEKDVNNLGTIVRHIRDEEIPYLKERDNALELALNNLKSTIGEVSISGLDKRLAASETIITGIKIVASGFTLAIMGIAAAAIFGGP